MSAQLDRCGVQRPARRGGAVAAGVLAGALVLGFGAMPASALSTTVPLPAPPSQIAVVVHPASGEPSSYFDVTTPAGQTTAAGVIQVANPTSVTQVVDLDPVQAITTDTLGSAYQQVGGATDAQMSWVRLSARKLTIAPGGSGKVLVALEVPAGQAAGDYLSGVSVQAQDQTGTASPAKGFQIGETYRYAVGVQTSVPGPRRPHLAFTGASVQRQPSSVVFNLAAHNDGNVILKNVTGQATVSRAGQTVATVPIGPGTFVSGTAIQFPVRAPNETPAEGTRYRVQARMVYAGGVATLDTEVTFGKAAAAVQRQYASPAAGRSADKTSGWATAAAATTATAVVLVVCLIGGFLLVLARRRHRTVALNRRQLLRLMDRELSGAAAGSAAMSLVHIGVAGSSETDRRRLVAALKPALRAADQVADLAEAGIIIALPHTGDAYAMACTREVEGLLERRGDSFAVDSVTSVDGESSDSLLARMLQHAQGLRHPDAAPELV